MAPCRRLQFNLSDMYPVPRLGVAQLVAALRAEGHTADFVDVIAERWQPERFGQRIAEREPDLVGVSATIMSMREAFELCRAARAARPSVVTVVGGPGVGGWTPEELFEYAGGSVDYFVRGEGERAMTTLVAALEEGGALGDVPGLLWLDGSRPAENAAGHPLELESAPGPAWDVLPMDRYRLHPPMGVYPYATLLESARGCTYPCNFCCLAGPLRTRSVSWIDAQVRGLHERYGAREVHFVDPTFTLDRDRALAICDALGRLPFELHWSCKSRVDHIDDELASAMRRAGCYSIAFGVESGADRVLESMRKRAAVETTRHAFSACRRRGIRTIAYCLVAGPDETGETVEETVRFVREIRADYVLYGIVDPDPANSLTRRAIREGRFTADDLARFYLGEGSTPLHHTTVTGHPMTRAQRWLRQASTDFYLRPRYAWGRVRDLRSLQDARNLVSGGTGFVRDLLEITDHWRHIG